MCFFIIKWSSAVKGSQHLIPFQVCTSKLTRWERRSCSPWLAKCRLAQEAHEAQCGVPARVSIPFYRSFWLSMNATVVTVLFCVHALSLYHECTLGLGNMDIWCWTIAFTACLWMYSVQRADLSPAVSQNPALLLSLKGDTACRCSLLLTLLWVKLKDETKLPAGCGGGEEAYSIRALALIALPMQEKERSHLRVLVLYTVQKSVG